GSDAAKKRVAIRFRITQALPSVSARKKTQPRHTKENVAAIRKRVPGEGSNRPPAGSSSERRRSHSEQTTTPRPWKAPQTTKVHEAPCHRPLSRKVMNRLRIVCALLPRLPPSGMYT